MVIDIIEFGDVCEIPNFKKNVYYNPFERKETMQTTPEHDERMAKMTFASVYPHYVSKVEKKGRKIEELHQVIMWLTGFDDQALQRLIDEKATFQDFFEQANLNPQAPLITGLYMWLQN
jgi:hypothetical protein